MLHSVDASPQGHGINILNIVLYGIPTVTPAPFVGGRVGNLRVHSSTDVIRTGCFQRPVISLTASLRKPAGPPIEDRGSILVSHVEGLHDHESLGASGNHCGCR